MIDLFKKDPPSETNKMTSVQNEREMPKGPKTHETTGKADNPTVSNEMEAEAKRDKIASQVDAIVQIEESPIAPDVLDLLASFQKMRKEEQELVEIKQDLLTKQQDLQSQLVKEIDKKKISIDNLKSEIMELQNRCKQLGQVLGADIYK